MIPLTDLKRQHERLAHEIEPVLLEFMRRQEFILGPKVAEFEQRMAEYLGAPAAVGVSSASDGLLLSLLDAGIGPGDEVITTPLTFVATGEAIVRAGAVPVFADIESEQLGLCPESVEERVTSRTKAVLAVHLFGHVGQVESLVELCRRRGLVLIEDVAQALGAKVGHKFAGTFGSYGVFSFFPAKILGGAGDGGLVVCSPERALKLRQLRVHGHVGGGMFEAVGGNFRLDALQSVLLLVKLRYVEEFIALRSRLAANYELMLSEANLPLRLPAARGHARSAWNNYVVRVACPDELSTKLRVMGIETARYYHTPLHLQPCFRGRCHAENLAEAERIGPELLALPLFPELTLDEQREVVHGLSSVLAGAGT
jgi:dTDP-4-amino-4,6-dideoxygalactose transaminase